MDVPPKLSYFVFLEYGSIIWSCYNKSIIVQLESIQRHASKYILKEYCSTYNERLLTCNILPLSQHREYLDLSFFYNCTQDKVDLNINNYVEMYENPRVTRSQDSEGVILKIPKVNKNFCMHFYNNRIANMWNKVPADISSIELSPSGSSNNFKRALKGWLLEKLNYFDSYNSCTWVISCICPRCKVV